MTYQGNNEKLRRRDDVLGSITLIAFMLAGIFIFTLLMVDRASETSATISKPQVSSLETEGTGGRTTAPQ